MKSQTPAVVRRASARLGEHVTAWRKLHGLTAAQVAERAGVSRGTLRRIEHGDTGVSLDSLLRVVRILGQIDLLVDAIDPYETDLGRARAEEQLPTRVRPRS